MLTRPGLLITFEGLGGSGKSTLARSVAAWLTGLGADVVSSHEPGATALGVQLRELLLNRERPPMSLATAFLFEADRAQTYAEVILPAIHAGQVVVSDRNVYGTFAYQGEGQGIDRALIETMSRAAVQGHWPDLVFVLDADPKVTLPRKHGQDEVDRFDEEGLAFQERVRQGYLLAATRDAERAHVLDAALGAEEVLRMTQAVILRFFQQRGRPL